MVIMKPTTHFQCGLSKVAIRLSTGAVNCEVCSSSSNSINSSLILFSVTNDGRVGLVFPARTETTFYVHWSRYTLNNAQGYSTSGAFFSSHSKFPFRVHHQSSSGYRKSGGTCH